MNKKDEETKFFDFTQVDVEFQFDDIQKMDVSKTLGNTIHMATGDIGLDEVARTIYKEGKADIPQVYIAPIIAILKDPNTPMVVGAKKAVIEMLNK